MSKKVSKTEFEKLLGPEGNEAWIDKVQYRSENKEWLRLSSDIALKILQALKKEKLSQKELANRMGVTPQQVSKIVKGGENLSLQTIAKIEKALGVKILSILDTNEIIVKNDMKSLMMLIATQIIRQQYQKNQILRKKQTQDLITPSKKMDEGFLIKQDFAKFPLNRKSSTGESNYAMAA